MPHIIGIQEKCPSFIYSTYIYDSRPDAEYVPDARMDIAAELEFFPYSEGCLPVEQTMSVFYLFLQVAFTDPEVVADFFASARVSLIVGDKSCFEAPAALLVANAPAEAEETGYNVAEALAGNGPYRSYGDRNGDIHAKDALAEGPHPPARYTQGWFGIMKLDPPIFVSPRMHVRLRMSISPGLAGKLFNIRNGDTPGYVLLQAGLGGKLTRDVL